MKREFLKDLGLEDGNIDKIMAELGKEKNTDNSKVAELEEQLKTANGKIEKYESKVQSLNTKIDENSKVNEELEALKKQIADEKAETEKAQKDAILTKNIEASFGDKEFVNDFTKQAIINEVKQGLANENNAGKSAKDIFDEVTKGRQDIFVNPNQVKDMAGMGDNDSNPPKKEMPLLW